MNKQEWQALFAQWKKRLAIIEDKASGLFQSEAQHCGAMLAIGFSDDRIIARILECRKLPDFNRFEWNGTI